MPSVSIIFPMYNVADYVENSLRSILNQTYKDYEIVAVNDGSTDATEDVFNRVLHEYNKDIKITLINKSNGGLSDARNAALLMAKGEWVVFIDSDDVIHPQYLEILISDSKKFNADLSIASFKRVNSDNLFKFCKTEHGTTVSKRKLMKLMLSRRKFEAYCGCFLVKRSILFEKGIMFNKEVKFSVDQAFMWNLVDISNVITLNYSKIYNYFEREGSIMTSSRIEQICSGLNHYSNIVNSLQHLPFSSEALINRWKIGILHSTAKLVTFEQFREVEDKFSMDYLKTLEVPLITVKLLSAIGLVSDKLLYYVLQRY